MNKKRLILVVLVSSLAFMACSLIKPLNVKQQAIVWMDVYNAAFLDTMAMANNPNATEAQKEMVVKKKELLGKIWPLLILYVDVVKEGKVPSPQSTEQLNNLINQLTSMIVGG